MKTTTTDNLVANDSGAHAYRSDAAWLADVTGLPVERAQRALDEAGGLVALLAYAPDAMADVGITPAAAKRLVGAVKLVERARVLRASAPSFQTGDDVAAHFGARLGHLDHEELWVAVLDGRNRARAMLRVAQGGRHGMVVMAREVLSAVLRAGGSTFILVHNHPSGCPEPSATDVDLTRAIQQAGNIVGVPLLDHVVVAAGGRFVSMAEKAILNFERGRR